MNACGGETDFACPRSRRMSLTFDCIRDAVTNLYRVDDFSLEELGTGFFSRVYKVQHRATDEVMVLKLNKNASNRQQALKEVQLMKRLSHPNILRFLGVCVHEGQLHPLTEFINGGNLEELLLDRKPALPWTLRLGLARDIARGMGYLHSRGVIHRDLTSKNCLIRQLEGGKLSAVVADFGLAAKLPRMSLTPDGRHVLSVVGTPYFSAPEVLRGERYDEKADVFSFGIILCQVIARIVADPEELPRTNSFGVDEFSLRRKCVDCPSVLWNLAMDCCQLDPSERPDFPTAEQRLGTSLLMPCPDTPPLPSELNSCRAFELFSLPLRGDQFSTTTPVGANVRRSASFNHIHRSSRSKSVDRTFSSPLNHTVTRQPVCPSSVILQDTSWPAGMSGKGESNKDSCVLSGPSSCTDPLPLISNTADEACSGVPCAVDKEGFLTTRPCHLVVNHCDDIVRPNSTPPVICHHTTETFQVPQSVDSSCFSEELFVNTGTDENMGETIPLMFSSHCNGFATESPTLTPPPTPSEDSTVQSDVFHTSPPGRGPSPKMHRKGTTTPVRDTIMYPYSLHNSPRVRRKALVTVRRELSWRDRQFLDLDNVTSDVIPAKSSAQLSPDPCDRRQGSVPNVYMTTSVDKGVNRRHCRNATVSGSITSELTHYIGLNGFTWQTNSAPSSPSGVPHGYGSIFQNPGSEACLESNSQFSGAAGQSH